MVTSKISIKAGHLIAQRQEGKSEAFGQGAKTVIFAACPNGTL